jgi:phospholipid/cholesterol/gamma-HCH transport system substrate-binding protein
VSLLAQDERLAQRVGAVALLVLGATIACFVFLLGRLSLGSPIRIRVVFHHVAGLREHAALVVAGQPVGAIEAIVPLPHGAAGLLGGEVGVVAIVAIDRDDAWKVPARSAIFIASRGALSDRYLEVAAPPGEPGPAVRDGQELRGVDPPSLDNVLQHTWANMTTFKLFVDGVRPEIQALRGQLDRLRGELDQLAPDAGGAPAGVAVLSREARALLAAARGTYETSLGGDAGVEGMRATVRDARAAIAQLRAAIDALAPRSTALAADLARAGAHLAAAERLARAAHTLAEIRAALDKIDPVLARLDELGQRIAAGEGSLGRLMQDPEFPEDAKEVGKIMKRQPWKILARPPD